MLERLKVKRGPILLPALLIAGVTALLSLRGDVSKTVNDILSRSNNPPAAAPEAHPEESAEEIRIRKLEQRFAKFCDNVMAHLDEFVDSEEMRGKIRRTISIFRKNTQNPMRKRTILSAVNIGEEQGFYYEFDPELTDFARFNGRRRAVLLPGNFDPDNMVDLSFFGHEIVHTEHDEHYRSTVPPGRYEDYWAASRPGATDTVVLIPEEEADAIARQIEMMNVLMNGRLKQRILKNKPVKIATRNAPGAEFIRKYAAAYYRDPATFVQFVTEQYLRSGRRVVLYKPNLEAAFSDHP